MTVKEAAALLREYGIRDLIVKEDDKVYGLFTVRSFLRFVMRENDRALLNIHYSGIGKTSLERTEAFKLRDFCSNEAKRFSERFGEVESFNFRFKEMKSGGKSHKYSVHLRVMMGSNELQTESSGWDLLKAVKDCYKSLTVLVKKGQGR